MFGPGGATEDAAARIEFPLAPEMTVGELEDFYGVRIDSPPAVTIAELIEQRIGHGGLAVDDFLQLGDVLLRVREMHEERIGQVALEILMGSEAATESAPSFEDDSGVTGGAA